jgi:ribosomal protein S8
MNNSVISQLNLAVKKHSKMFICDKTKFNVKFFKLLLKNGFILGFYQYRLVKNKLCIFLKYVDKKPLIRKLEKEKKNVFINANRFLGDIQANSFFVISTSIGGLLLVSSDKLNGFNWYSKIGGTVLIKVCV